MSESENNKSNEKFEGFKVEPKELQDFLKFTDEKIYKDSTFIKPSHEYVKVFELQDAFNVQFLSGNIPVYTHRTTFIDENGKRHQVNQSAETRYLSNKSDPSDEKDIIVPFDRKDL